MTLPLVNPDALGIATLVLEAGSETDQGMLAVAEVIRNRTKTFYESDGTVAGTVFRPLQFSAWNGDDPRRGPVCALDVADPLVQRAKRAWDTAWDQGSDIAGGAVMYYAPRSMRPVGTVPPWVAAFVFVGTFGTQRFYRRVAGAATT